MDRIDRRELFTGLKCPYCGYAPGWLFDKNDLGQKLIDCDECGKTFVADLGVTPKVNAVWKMEQVK